MVLLVTFVVAAWAGFLLLKAINVPMQRLVEVVDAMRTGDLSQRLQLDRGDEFGTLEAGFNRMTDELTGLVGQAQKSAVQVTTSVTEIAATAREQQATASEIAATTTEIGATSREIFATSRDLRAHDERSLRRRRTVGGARRQRARSASRAWKRPCGT